MSVKHHLLSHQPGAACGVSMFLEGRKPTVTVVVTELPDNPGTPVKNSLATAARRIRKTFLKGVPAGDIAWVYRTPGSESDSESMFAVKLDDTGCGICAMDELKPARLASIVNRGGGFQRRGVFVPPFRSVPEIIVRRRSTEPVNHEPI